MMEKKANNSCLIKFSTIQLLPLVLRCMTYIPILTRNCQICGTILEKKGDNGVHGRIRKSFASGIQQACIAYSREMRFMLIMGHSRSLDANKLIKKAKMLKKCKGKLVFNPRFSTAVEVDNSLVQRQHSLPGFNNRQQSSKLLVANDLTPSFGQGVVQNSNKL